MKENLFEEQQKNFMMQPAVNPSFNGRQFYWNPKSILSRFKVYLYRFFSASFKLSAGKALGPTVRLCDIGTLYYKLLKPWESSCEFYNNCMIAQNLINKYEEEEHWRKEVKIKPE